MSDTTPVTGDQLVEGDLITGPVSQRTVVLALPVLDERLLAVLGQGAQVLYATAACGDNVPPRPYTRDDVVTVALPRPLAVAS